MNFLKTDFFLHFYNQINLPRKLKKKHISPAAGSPTTTLLRLDPSYQPQINKISLKIENLIFNLIDFQRVTGGVYKTWVHIHRSMLIYDY